MKRRRKLPFKENHKFSRRAHARRRKRGECEDLLCACVFVSCTMAEEDRSRTPADQLWRIPRLGTHRLSDAPSSVWYMDFREEWRHRKLETVNIDTRLTHSDISSLWKNTISERYLLAPGIRWVVIYLRWCNPFLLLIPDIPNIPSLS